MKTLTDPGKALIAGKTPTKAQATAARMTAWAKPAKQTDRDKLRAERIAAYEEAHGKLPEKPKKPIEGKPADPKGGKP